MIEVKKFALYFSLATVPTATLIGISEYLGNNDNTLSTVTSESDQSEDKKKELPYNCDEIPPYWYLLQAQCD